MKPSADQAYPIARAEWRSIRERLGGMSGEPFALQTAGSLTLGVVFALVINLATGAYSADSQRVAFAVAATASCCLTLVGIAFYYLAGEQRKLYRSRISDIVDEMKRIEARFAAESPPKADASDPLDLADYVKHLRSLNQAMKSKVEILITPKDPPDRPR